MQKGNKKKPLRKPQHQRRPGIEKNLSPLPIYDYPEKPGTGKLAGKKYSLPAQIAELERLWLYYLQKKERILLLPI